MLKTERKKLFSIFLFLSLIGLFLPIFSCLLATSIAKKDGIDTVMPVTQPAIKSPYLDGNQQSIATATNQSYDLTKIYDMNALHPTDILANGSALYVAGGNAGLFIYNVSDPTNPLLTFFLPYFLLIFK